MCVLLLSGCNFNKGDNLKSFINYNTNKDTYELTGKMSIISNEDEFTYDVKVSVEDTMNYKVDLINTINDHEQVILKNDDGVYVGTHKSTKQKINII